MRALFTLALGTVLAVSVLAASAEARPRKGKRSCGKAVTTFVMPSGVSASARQRAQFFW
jgi:hypothetical protein